LLLDARLYLSFTTIKYVKSVQLHEGITKGSWTKSVTKIMLTSVTVYAVGPVFLLLEAPQKLAFLNHVYSSQQAFLNFRDVPDTMPL
jgi:hypothetical protein